MNDRNAELEALFNRIADGIASEADEERLGQMLRSSAEARQAYRQFMDLHSALHWDYVAVAGPEIAPERSPSRSSSHVVGRTGWLSAFLAGIGVATVAAIALGSMWATLDQVFRLPLYPGMLLFGYFGAYATWRVVQSAEDSNRRAQLGWVVAAGVTIAWAQEFQTVGQLFYAVPLLIAIVAPAGRRLRPALMVGAATVLLSGIVLVQPVLIIANLPALAVYGRNLYFIYKRHQQTIVDPVHQAGTKGVKS